MREKIKKIVDKIKCYLPLILCIGGVAFIVLGLWCFQRYEEKHTVSASASSAVAIEENVVEIPLSMFSIESTVAGSKFTHYFRDTLTITQSISIDYSNLLNPYVSGSLRVNSRYGEILCLIFANPDSMINGVKQDTCTMNVYYYDTGLGFERSTTMTLNYSGVGLGWFDCFNIALFNDNSIGITCCTESNNEVGNFTFTLGFTQSNYGFNSLGNIYTPTAPFVIHSPFNKKDAYNAGYTEGYDKGQFDGFDDGYADGYADGNIDGYDDGYDDGYYMAYENLRDEVENEVLNDKETFLDGIFSVFDAPVRVIREMFNFELFGINISSAVFFVLTIVVVVFVIRKFRG